MGNEVVQVQNAKNIDHINKTFNITSTVESLHHLMKEVTSKEINPATVNAACNCVQQLNKTIDMTIKAARFLNGSQE